MMCRVSLESSNGEVEELAEYELRVKRLVPEARLPERSHQDDAGLDLYALGPVEIAPGEIRGVKTGVALELPSGTEGQIRPRSGLALRYGVTVLNSPGTIDQGYRGEIEVILVNHGKAPFVVQQGFRIAQLVVQRRLSTRVVQVSALSRGSRGTDGLGSTGDA